MPPLARGAALVDPSGGLVACDEGFRRALDLGEADAAEAWRARVAAAPALAGLLRGEGPSGLAIDGAGGEPLHLACERSRVGLLLVARATGDDELLEHAARSQGLAQLAGGLSHEVNGPLNTMTLQLALLEAKLSGGPGEPLAASHLAVMRDQVGRVARLVRRFRELAEPHVIVGGLDLGALAAEAVALITPDLRRRDIQATVEAPAGVARTSAPADRAARLALGVLQHAAAATSPRGELSVAVGGGPDGSTLTVVHTQGATPPGLGYYPEVAAEAAEALGGRLTRAAEGGRERVTLLLPTGQQP